MEARSSVNVMGYKAPSTEKARMTLLDACKRNVENELALVRDMVISYIYIIYTSIVIYAISGLNSYIIHNHIVTTKLQLLILLNRYTQGVSIVSDGWTSVKNKPLINVIASNSRGSMFFVCRRLLWNREKR